LFAKNITVMNFRLLSFFLSIITTTTVLLFSQSVDSIAKPNNRKPVNSSNVTNIGDGIKFTFHECTQIPSQEKVICQGTFRGSNGDKILWIYRRLFGVTKIVDSTGKNHIVNEIKIGEDLICAEREDCSQEKITLVQGVDYKATFVFTDILLKSSRIPLLSIEYGFSSVGADRVIKYRDILVR
jgi:hypothetical protein